LKFVPPVEPAPVLGPVALVEVPPEPTRPTLVVRYPGDFSGPADLTVAHAEDPQVSLGLVLADGSRMPAQANSRSGEVGWTQAPSGPVKTGEGRRLSTRLRVAPSPLRVYSEADRVAVRGLRQA
jgi:hypothetical protein